MIVYVAATAFRRKSVYHRDPRCVRVGVRYDREQHRWVPSCSPVDEAQAVGAGLRPCPLCTDGLAMTLDPAKEGR